MSSAGWRKKFSKVFLFGDSLTQQSFNPGKVSETNPGGSLEAIGAGEKAGPDYSYPGGIGGWGARLADHFQRKADVFNRGFSGYNSEWGKLILPDLLTSKDQADCVTVFFGANDAAFSNVNPHLKWNQHVPLPNFKSNLVEICTYLTSIGIPKYSIILITPPPVCDDLWKVACKENSIAFDRCYTVTKQYADAAVQAGQELDVTTVDLYSSMPKEQDRIKQYFSDGVHFNSDGNQFLAERLIPIVESKLDTETSVFPDFKDVNAKCPRESFRLE